MTPLAAYLLLFLAVGAGFILVHLLAGKLIRPNTPDAEKGTIYECGEPTIGSAWIQFDLRFYVVALLFVIFDVEVAFFFPWAEVFGNANAVATAPPAPTANRPWSAAEYNDYARHMIDLAPPPAVANGDPKVRNDLGKYEALAKLTPGDLEAWRAIEPKRKQFEAKRQQFEAKRKQLEAAGKEGNPTADLEKELKALEEEIKPLEAQIAPLTKVNVADLVALQALTEEERSVVGKLTAQQLKDAEGPKNKDLARLSPAAREALKKVAPGDLAILFATPPAVRALLDDLPVERNRDTASQLAWLAFAEVVVFFGVLLVGFAYLWRRGDLAWVRSVSARPPVGAVAKNGAATNRPMAGVGASERS